VICHPITRIDVAYLRTKFDDKRRAGKNQVNCYCLLVLTYSLLSAYGCAEQPLIRAEIEGKLNVVAAINAAA